MSNRILSKIFQIVKKAHCCRKNLLTYSQLRQKRMFSAVQKESPPTDLNVETKADDRVAIGIDAKYKIFHDKDAQIILDVTDEQGEINIEDINAVPESRNPYEGLNMERGINGVYDIDDLISVLKKDNAKDIFVASVPKELTYVDYIVIVTAKSRKHMSALATFVRKVYKMKRSVTDILPKIEGEGSNDWVAMDLGNIALHIFSSQARTHYDLETLWTVGSQYDDKSNEPDTEDDILQRYNAFLTDLQPADT